MIELHPVMALTLNMLMWPCWSIAVGYWGHRRAIDDFTRDSWWSKPRRFEADGSCYARAWRIKAWKDLMPESGGFFPGGFVKRFVCRDREHLARFVIETRRAEWVHWVIVLAWPLSALWNPPWAVGLMLLYAIAANLPCIVIQRYNRARLLRALERSPAGGKPAVLPQGRVPLVFLDV